jgi:ATP-dependent Clp protease protease subunit
MRTVENTFAEGLAKGTVRITGALNNEQAELAAAQLLYLESYAPTAPITVQVSNCTSGSLTAALAVLDVLRFLRVPVHTMGAGDLNVLAVMLVAAGTPGKRALEHGATVSLSLGLPPAISHAPFEGQLDGSLRLLEANALRQRVTAVLAELTGHSLLPIEWLGVNEEREFITAADAVSYGLADTVMPSA